ncbi:MAG TPA: SelB C-terminal domain-containing protein [Gaiellaceae bacterium]
MRSVQVHGGEVERAEAGSRVAVAITAERRRVVGRGDVLVAAGAFPVSFRLDVDLDGDVGDGARVLVCHGTRAVPARVVRLADGRAQLRLDQPVVAARGDRFVLRRDTTVGGGRVLDPAPPRHRSADAVGAATVYEPIHADELAIRGLDVSHLERAGEWVFSAAWLEDLRAHVAAGGVVARSSWSRDVMPLLRIERKPAAEPDTGDVRLGDGSTIARADYDRAKALAVEECERTGTITLARFRDLLGSSRRVSQLLLERFDADRVTLRVGDERRLRRGVSSSTIR